MNLGELHLSKRTLKQLKKDDFEILTKTLRNG